LRLAAVHTIGQVQQREHGLFSWVYLLFGYLF
jgi:hypothetical protein